MKESEYIRLLEKGLGSLSAVERQELLQDYRDHFREGKKAGKSEEEISRALGDPARAEGDLLDEEGNKREPFDCMAVRDDPVSCGVQRSLSLSPEDPGVEILGDLPGVSLLDYSDLHCGPDDCPVVVGNVLVYRDAHHFTKTFVLTMKPFIERDLGEALGWFPDRH